tara:strand:+ start:985 stop:1398 length:414 start_codon:yes stop_codon:yes gene_type:complete
MKLKLLGSKVRVEIIILCVLMGVIIGTSLLCSCSCSRENFHNASPIGGDLRQYDFSKHGVQHNKGAVQNQPSNPMMPGQKYFWANNKFTPECCDYSSVSGPNGCACVTDEQMKYLASRGGNRSNSSILSQKDQLDEF